MKLYYHPFSPNSQKVVALAYECEIAIDLAFVDVFQGESKLPELVALNPNGRVPILVDGDFALWESNAMLAYVAEKAGRSELAPSSGRARAEVERWLAWLNAHFGPAVGQVALERIVKPIAGREPPDEARIAAGLAQSALYFGVLDTMLRGREYLAGPLTIAEFAIAPEVAVAPACGIDLGRYPNVASWFERVSARPSFQRTFEEARTIPPTRTVDRAAV